MSHMSNRLLNPLFCIGILLAALALMTATWFTSSWPFPAIPLLAVQGSIAGWEIYLLAGRA